MLSQSFASHSYKQIKHPFFTAEQISEAQKYESPDHTNSSPYHPSMSSSPYTPIFPSENDMVAHPHGLYPHPISVSTSGQSPALSNGSGVPHSSSHPDMGAHMVSSGVHTPGITTPLLFSAPTGGDLCSSATGLKFVNGGQQFYSSGSPNESHIPPHSPMASLEHQGQSMESPVHPSRPVTLGSHHAHRQQPPVMFNQPSFVALPYSTIMGASATPHPASHASLSSSNDGHLVPYQSVEPRMEGLLGYPSSFNFSYDLQPPLMNPSMSFSSDYSASSRDSCDYPISAGVLHSPHGGAMLPDFATSMSNGGGYQMGPNPDSVHPMDTEPNVPRSKRKRGNPRPRRSAGEKPKSNTHRDPKEKRFPCPVEGCGVRFNRAEHVQRHYKSIHLKVRPFECPEPGCGKVFSRTDNLTQHRNTHNRSKSKAKEREYHTAFVNTTVPDTSSIKRRME
ncbi:hypothetical protein H4R33_003776 [Dimargaris cristalligena]|nr:hypothetical protein H4R33_003776 [Dimargaris cristalligena]